MKSIALVAVAIGLVAPTAAIASVNSACRTAPCSVSANRSTTDHPFPFTLLDLALLGAGAAALLTAGIAARRLSAGEPYEACEAQPEPIRLNEAPVLQLVAQPPPVEPLVGQASGR